MFAARLRELFPDLAPRVDDLYLLEAHQVSSLPSRAPDAELAAVLHADPGLRRFLVARQPSIGTWLGELLARHGPRTGSALAVAEETLLWELADEIVYQRAPEAYDEVARQGWHPSVVTDVVDLEGATVIDAGAGTGLVAFSVAPRARTVFAVEPVAALRAYMRAKAAALGFTNVFVLDGTLSAIPLPAAGAEVLITCRAIGWDLPAELAEIGRLLSSGGTALHLTGLPQPALPDDPLHGALVAAGYRDDAYDGPSGPLRRYRLRKP